MAAAPAAESVIPTGGKYAQLMTPVRTIPVPPLDRPARRPGQGRLRPPTRRRVAGAPRVVAQARCARRGPVPVPVLLGLASLAAAAVYGLGLFAGSVAGGADVPVTTTVVRVQPGEGLSDVAARMAPDSDNAAVVARIRELNRLSGGSLRSGQPLTVPFSR
ncbi:hypothetical protein UO65_6416 [Actinokineospora spheciospongiae]|uniref:LysM domain-containing protein n=1 Tax=Actinokineospora spheciospongiae TaxID=909613 RepID=W7IW82_9PSEU|nr:LysM peptidoglycan-binding domain-containing protein [Actinokineospora spheciospongiae]EWC58274.1 hypothetical protein UO65_6416 [Actinokineospora spheciospongiae]